MKGGKERIRESQSAASAQGEHRMHQGENKM